MYYERQYFQIHPLACGCGSPAAGGVLRTGAGHAVVQERLHHRREHDAPVARAGVGRQVRRRQAGKGGTRIKYIPPK